MATERRRCCSDGTTLRTTNSIWWHERSIGLQNGTGTNTSPTAARRSTFRNSSAERGRPRTVQRGTASPTDFELDSNPTSRTSIYGDPAWDSFGDYTRLEAACRNVGIRPEDTDWAEYDHGIDLDTLRPEKFQGFEKVINKDIPVFGERYIALAAAGATETLTFRSLHELLEHYGREDIVHLFDLADARPF
jgi:hypothetical protein